MLASRPEGAPVKENFRLEEVTLPQLAEGQILLKTVYLSLDPSMRGRTSEAPSYTAPVALGEVMVGVAGGPQKCAYAVDTLGLDACLNHKSGDFAEQLQAACPAGVDIYYENVGARIPVCGLISRYNATSLPDGPDRLLKAGSIHYREQIVDGLVNAPQAFIGLLEGESFGKLIIRIAQEN